MPPNKKKSLRSRARAHITRAIENYGDRVAAGRFYERLLPAAFLFGVLIFLLYFLTAAAPLNFPGASLVKITADESPQDVAYVLKERGIIRSGYLFELGLKLYGHSKVIPGEYFFPSAQDIFTVSRRLARGDFELTPIRITIPEGVDSFEIGDLLGQKLPDFDTEWFVEDAQPNEGYLFPDTYFFLPGENPDTLITALETNFKKHIDDPGVAGSIKKFGKPLGDIVTMASLLEREAPDMHDRQIIAGILWHRLALGMPLQVDAVFPYIIGKNSFNLTRADLKTNSPYNTYTNKGLPPGPIANPGIAAIMAAITPIQTNYLYYLSDLQGNFHYSVTYAQQLVNQRRYLKN